MSRSPEALAHVGVQTSAAMSEGRPAPEAPQQQERREPLAHRRVIGWALIVSLFLFWEIAAHIAPSPGLPAPSRIGNVWWSEISSGNLIAELGDTLISMAYGFIAATIIGTTIGILMARIRFFYALLEPLVECWRPIPTVIFIPVIILYVGLGRPMNILVIIIAATEPVLLNAFAGGRALSSALRDTAATFRLTWWQTLGEIVLPAAAPQIFVGLRLALASSLVVAISAGMIAGNSGIGYYIVNAQQTLDIPRMYAGAATVALVGYGLNSIFLFIERRLLHWHAGHNANPVV